MSEQVSAQNHVPPAAAGHTVKEAAVEPLASFNPCARGEDAPSGRNAEESFGEVLQEHSYYCSHSPKALKLALDRSLQMEQKLEKTLRNAGHQEQQLSDRVCLLLWKLKKRRLSKRSAHRQQPSIETGQVTVHTLRNPDACYFQLDPNETSEKDKSEVLLRSEHGKTNKRWSKSQQKHENPAQNEPNASSEHERSVIRSSLKTNHTAETAVRPFTCVESSNICRLAANMTRRPWMPTGKKLYLCEECGKMFNDLARLMAHQYRHTREKQYPCTVCGISFIYNSYISTQFVSSILEEDCEESLYSEGALMKREIYFMES